MTTHVNTVIVGGGQAGLAVSYFLTLHGRDHLVIEQANALPMLGGIIAGTASRSTHPIGSRSSRERRIRMTLTHSCRGPRSLPISNGMRKFCRSATAAA